MGVLYHKSRNYGIIRDGKVAEWLKALVLKTRDGNIRRFESCPFRHFLCHFLVDINFGVGGGVDAEIAEDNHFIVGNHMSRMEFGALELVKTL